jgi:hypothetical protein
MNRKLLIVVDEYISQFIENINDEFGISKTTLNTLWQKISSEEEKKSPVVEKVVIEEKKSPVVEKVVIIEKKKSPVVEKVVIEEKKSPVIEEKKEDNICQYKYTKLNKICDEKASVNSKYCSKHKRLAEKKQEKEEKEEEKMDIKKEEKLDIKKEEKLDIKKHKATGYFVDANTRFIVKSKEDLTVIGKILLNNSVRTLIDEDIKICKNMNLKYEVLDTLSQEKKEDKVVVEKKKETEEKKKEEIIVEKKEESIPKGKGLIKGKIEKKEEEKPKTTLANKSNLKELISSVSLAKKEETLISEDIKEQFKNKSISEVLNELTEETDSEEELLDDDN